MEMNLNNLTAIENIIALAIDDKDTIIKVGKQFFRFFDSLVNVPEISKKIAEYGIAFNGFHAMIDVMKEIYTKLNTLENKIVQMENAIQMQGLFFGQFIKKNDPNLAAEIISLLTANQATQTNPAGSGETPKDKKDKKE
jgi:hypothetical protein